MLPFINDLVSNIPQFIKGRKSHDYNDADKALYRKYLESLRLDLVEKHIAEELAKTFHQEYATRIQQSCMTISNLDSDANFYDIVRHGDQNKKTRTFKILTDIDHDFSKTQVYQRAAVPNSDYHRAISTPVNDLVLELDDSNKPKQLKVPASFNDVDQKYYDQYCNKLGLFKPAVIQQKITAEISKELDKAYKETLNADCWLSSSSNYPGDGTLEDKIEHAFKPKRFSDNENNRLFTVLSDPNKLGWIDSHKKPTEKCPAVFAATWNMQRAQKKDTAQDIIDKITAKHTQLQRGSLLFRSHFSDLIQGPLTTDAFLAVIINKALDGGTFGFGKSRTFEAMQALGYLNSEGNPTVKCKVFKDAWDAVKAERAAPVVAPDTKSWF